MPPKARNSDATTPSRTPALKRQGSSVGKQSSILGFFSKTPTSGLPVLKKENKNDETPKLNETSDSKANATPKPQPSTAKKSFAVKVVEDVQPVPSSDLPHLRSSQEENRAAEPASEANTIPFSSPSRRVSIVDLKRS